MNKLPFVIWMLGFPTVLILKAHIYFLDTGHLRPPESDTDMSALAAVYLAVAFFAYQKDPSK